MIDYCDEQKLSSQFECEAQSHPLHAREKYQHFCLESGQSEYVAECDLRREFISGFNGSAGEFLIVKRMAT